MSFTIMRQMATCTICICCSSCSNGMVHILQNIECRAENIQVTHFYLSKSHARLNHGFTLTCVTFIQLRSLGKFLGPFVANPYRYHCYTDHLN